MGFVLAKVSRPFHTLFRHRPEYVIDICETGFKFPQNGKFAVCTANSASLNGIIRYETHFIWSIYHTPPSKVKQIAQILGKTVDFYPNRPHGRQIKNRAVGGRRRGLL